MINFKPTRIFFSLVIHLNKSTPQFFIISKLSTTRFFFIYSMSRPKSLVGSFLTGGCRSVQCRLWTIFSGGLRKFRTIFLSSSESYFHLIILFSLFRTTVSYFLLFLSSQYSGIMVFRFPTIIFPFIFIRFVKILQRNTVYPSSYYFSLSKNNKSFRSFTFSYLSKKKNPSCILSFSLFSFLQTLRRKQCLST